MPLLVNEQEEMTNTNSANADMTQDTSSVELTQTQAIPEREWNKIELSRIKKKVKQICRELKKTIKKAKGFLVQKTARKIQKARATPGGQDASGLETYLKDLESIKKIRLPVVSLVACLRFFEHPDLPRQAILLELACLGKVSADTSELSSMEEKLLAGKEITSACDTHRKDLMDTIQNKRRRGIAPNSSQSQPKKVSTQATELALDDSGLDAESQFVATLNDGYSDISLSEDGNEDPDLDLDGIGGYPSSKKQKKKKNRPGQMARRKMWEEMYGKDANHIKTEVLSQKKSEPPEPEEPSHPSWQAKRKQKPVIAQFQGRKMTFGDNEDNTAGNGTSKGPKSTEDLHPSWKAKKLAQEKMSQMMNSAKPKKIVFGDE